MNQATLAQRAEETTEFSPEKLTEFLAALTELSTKYGIGITGSPVLFLLEKEDFLNEYRVDSESNLTLG